MLDVLLGAIVFVTRVTLSLVYELIVQFVGYATARLVLPVLSLGRMRVEDGPFTLAAGWKRTPRGIIVRGDLAAFLGLLFWIVLAVLLIAVRKLWSS